MRLRGVTLLEMLVVVAIIGILAAVATPAVEPAVKRARLRGAAEEVAGFIDDARHRAVTQGRCFRVRVVGGDTLILERRSSVDCVDLAADGWEPAERTKTLRGFAIVGEAVPAVPADERFVFRPSSRLRGDGTLTTTASGSRLEIALPGSPERSPVTATRLGRVCAALHTTAPPPLAAPVECP
jgi:type IV fimbrial biogenesis protein FimT